MKSRRNKTILSNKRWAKYALAAAAGTTAVLSPQSQLDADFTWVPVGTFLEDQIIGDGYFTRFGPYTFGGSVASFTMIQAKSEVGPNFGQMALFGLGDIAFVGTSATYLYPSNLAYGQTIGTNLDFDLPSGVDYRLDMAWGYGYGSHFTEAGVGFVGFTFDLGGGAQFGFIEVVMDGAPLNTGTFVGFGYGDVGEAVFAGQRPSRNLPEPGALGVLALGSIGVLAWRRKRSIN